MIARFGSNGGLQKAIGHNGVEIRITVDEIPSTGQWVQPNFGLHLVDRCHRIVTGLVYSLEECHRERPLEKGPRLFCFSPACSCSSALPGMDRENRPRRSIAI